MPWSVAAAGIGALGAYTSSKNNKEAAQIASQNKLDPRVDAMVFGSNGQGGLLDQYKSYLNQPQSQPLQQYGKTAGDYLNNYGAADMGAIRNTATGLLQGNSAPQAASPAWAVGNQVQAPNQNGLDLSGSYNRFINGTPGANPYLQQSLKSAVGLTNAAYQQNQDSLTNNLTRSILPSLRSGAIAAGQYGSSRQGIAEGNALSDYTKQLTNANLQLGLANSANTTGQQANAYNADSDRALAATQGLGGQQYATAFQNANTKNQAEFMNVGNVQQNNLANQGAQLQTNAQNNSAALGGAGLLGSVSNSAYGTATNNQNYDINRATQVNGLLAPYLNANSATTQPTYQNGVGAAAGVASTIGGLLGNFQQGGGRWSGDSLPSASIPYTGHLTNYQGGAQNYTPSTSMPVNTGLLSNMSWFNG